MAPITQTFADGFRSVEIANEFIKRANASGQSLTNMQLQKLVYFAHGWSLAISGKRLTAEDPQAWDNGPVYRDLWEHLRDKGKSGIKSPLGPDDTNPFVALIKDFKPSPPYQAELNQEQIDLLDTVWARYGDYGAFKMSDMTHQDGTPWDKTYYGLGRNAPITADLIEEHYLKLGATSRERQTAAQ